MGDEQTPPRAVGRRGEPLRVALLHDGFHLLCLFALPTYLFRPGCGTLAHSATRRGFPDGDGCASISASDLPQRITTPFRAPQLVRG